jgi:hypothetical protein
MLQDYHSNMVPIAVCVRLCGMDAAEERLPRIKAALEYINNILFFKNEIFNLNIGIMTCL